MAQEAGICFMDMAHLSWEPWRRRSNKSLRRTLAALRPDLGPVGVRELSRPDLERQARLAEAAAAGRSRGGRRRYPPDDCPMGNEALAEYLRQQVRRTPWPAPAACRR